MTRCACACARACISVCVCVGVPSYLAGQGIPWDRQPSATSALERRK